MKELLEIMARLRDPAGGCPWDLQQTFTSVAPYTLEEAYEVADASERGDLPALEEELGDLLLQVVFHAQMASEQGAFDFERVAQGISSKMRRRHPHVFGDETITDAAAQSLRWEELKAAEKAARGAPRGLLQDVPLALPALTRAIKLGRRAARIGFDWPDAVGARAKVDEELAELDEAIGTGEQTRIREELGDVLLALSNLARKLDVDAEAELRAANGRFASRFGHVEQQVAAGRGGSVDDMERFWQEAKQAERNGD
ncbi:MAG: nucleoside triphosphate pyrophosphohydrolase [Proteobacteria bacterium]|nr:nucleoside triphosphate pyrophosphohydrolase [Pseudomonadota bacterium]